MTTAVRDPDGNALGAAAQAVFRTVEGLDGATAVWGVNTGTTTAAYDTYSNYYDGAAWEAAVNQGNNMNGTEVSGNSWGTATIITDYSESDETPVVGVSPGTEEIGFLLWKGFAGGRAERTDDRSVG